MIKMEGKSFKIYKDKGYIFNWRDTIEIKIEDLLTCSNAKISTECDVCGLVKEISYTKYNKNILRGGFYSCQKCSSIKRVDTCLEKYGVDNYVKTDKYKEKKKENCLEKYGVDSYLKTEDFRNKRTDTMLDKYGVENPLESPTIREKKVNTCLTKYGVDNPTKLESHQLKRKITNIKNGNQIPDNLITPFLLYKRKCRNLTNKVKGELFSNWDGYDYYDGEFIKNNLLLNHKVNIYPTIDHKITIWYGFMNNLTVEEISSINNLCITKRSINSRKNNLNESNFQNKQIK